MVKFKLSIGAVFVLIGFVSMTTAKQSSKHRIPDLGDLPDGELQKIRDKASSIHSKIVTELGLQMNTNRKSSATNADHKKQEELTKKLIALKLFMHENNQEQTKRRWTRDADWVSNDGQNEWNLDYSHNNGAWTATNPNYKPPDAAEKQRNEEAEKQRNKEALKYLAPYYPAASKDPEPKIPAPKTIALKKLVQIEPSHNHHQIPAIYKDDPPARSGKVESNPPTLSNEIQYSDNTGDDDDDDDKIDDGQVVMIVGGVALLLALIFMIYTTIQWVRTLEDLRDSQAQRIESVRLLENDLGIPNQKKDYVSIDFDGMVGLVDTTALPTQAPDKPTKSQPAPPKPSRRTVRNSFHESDSRISNRTSQSSSDSTVVFPSEPLMTHPEKPTRPSTHNMEEFKKRNNM